MRYRFYTADVFTEQVFGGNQLALFPDARGLDTPTMRQVAREFNLSETVFVFPPDDPANTRHLRIFTPGTELPFAGHPTIGTAHVLAAIGEIALDGPTTRIVFEEGVGPVPVVIQAENGRPRFAQLTAARLPEWGPTPPPETLAALLSLDADDLLQGADAPEAISCGVPFLFIPLRTLAAVERARLNLAEWGGVLASAWAPHVYIFSYETAQPGADLHARMFAPAMGIAEDPATGAAATALGGYLGKRDPRPEGTGRWVVEQGFEMGRPSILTVETDKAGGAITGVRVGGASVLVSDGTMDIPVAAS
jgi:trans-2,3-dihydro-3-hydroxyanthranilate isomerase